MGAAKEEGQQAGEGWDGVVTVVGTVAGNMAAEEGELGMGDRVEAVKEAVAPTEGSVVVDVLEVAAAVVGAVVVVAAVVEHLVGHVAVVAVVVVAIHGTQSSPRSDSPTGT